MSNKKYPRQKTNNSTIVDLNHSFCCIFISHFHFIPTLRLYLKNIWNWNPQEFFPDFMWIFFSIFFPKHAICCDVSRIILKILPQSNALVKLVYLYLFRAWLWVSKMYASRDHGDRLIIPSSIKPTTNNVILHS